MPNVYPASPNNANVERPRFCRFYFGGPGGCLKGDACNFSHDDKDFEFFEQKKACTKCGHFSKTKVCNWCYCKAHGMCRACKGPSNRPYCKRCYTSFQEKLAASASPAAIPQPQASSPQALSPQAQAPPQLPKDLHPCYNEECSNVTTFKFCQDCYELYSEFVVTDKNRPFPRSGGLLA